MNSVYRIRCACGAGVGSAFRGVGGMAVWRPQEGIPPRIAHMAGAVMSKRSETTVTLQAGDGEPVKVAAIDEFTDAVQAVIQSLDPSLTPGPSPTAEGDGGKPTGQLAMALCATCGHSQGIDHPEDGPCQVSWFDSDKVQQFCPCQEFWPWRPQLEDGWRVLEHEVSLGGSLGLVLDRREAQELWDSLRPGRSVRLTVVLQVGGKGFKAVRDKGAMVGLAEYRKLTAERVVWSFEERELDVETGELL